MNRLFVLLFLGLLVIANSEKLRSVSLKKGIAQIPRNLEVQETDTNTVKNVTASPQNLFSVATDFGWDYRNHSKYDDDKTFDMAVIISTNYTVFANGGSYFSGYNCYDDDLCTLNDGENDTVISIELPFGFANKVYTFNINYTNATQTTTPVSIINGSWELPQTATTLRMKGFDHFNYEDLYHESSYPGYTSSYGWIGLGTEGDASTYFTSGTPEFSFHLNASSNKGELLFGMDPSRLSSWEPATVLKTDENWRMNVTSITYGDGTNLTYTSNGTAMTLVFDVQVEQLHLPPSVNAQLRDNWNAANSKISYCGADQIDYQCSFSSNNLTDIPSPILNITFTLADGTNLTIDPYHYWSGYYYNDRIPEDPTDTNTWKSEIGQVSTNYSGSEYIVLGYRPMSQFYSHFEKTATGNQITLYPPAPFYDGYNYTVPEKPTNNGGSGDGGNTTTPGGTDGGSTDTSGDDEWITYLTYAGVAAVVIIFIVVIACCCCKSEPKPTAKKTLTVELRGADKSTESSVASSVRL